MILVVGDALSHQPAYSLRPEKTIVLGLSGKTKVAANDKNAPMNNSLTLQLCSVIITAQRQRIRCWKFAMKRVEG